jgi:hypothetical protein
MAVDSSTVLVVDDDLIEPPRRSVERSRYAVRVARGGQKRSTVVLLEQDGSIWCCWTYDGRHREYSVCQRLRSDPRTERLLIVMVPLR